MVKAIVSSGKHIFGIKGDTDTVARYAVKEYVFVPRASREASGEEDLSQIVNDLIEIRFLEEVSSLRYCLATEKIGTEVRVDKDYRGRLIRELNLLNQE